MIIFRYLSRELLIATLAVSAVLFVILLTGKFSDYLDDAAQGKLSVDVLFTVIGFRMTSFLELILPLGFYLAVLLAFGRLYMDSEMVVLSACGISQGQILRMTFAAAGLIAGIVALFSFWVSPVGAQLTEQTLAEQKTRSEFDSLQPGRFQMMSDNKVVAYIEGINDDKTELERVFVFHRDEKNTSIVIVADKGTQRVHDEFGQRYLVLSDGRRYQGEPGQQQYAITEFEDWGRYMPPSKTVAEITHKSDAKSTLELIGAQDLESIATLQWRISMPLMVIIATMLAVPLSKTNPRQGRYLKMLPAILIYVFYLAFLINARSSIAKGKLDPALGLWVVHLVFFTAAIIMLNWQRISRPKSRRKLTREVSHA